LKLSDRIALVTGGGSGIGRAICLTFAEEGARVVVNDIRLEAAEATVKEMSDPARGRAIQADVADSAQVRAMFATIERELGGLDILVNNAGIALGADEHREALRRKFETRIMETVSAQGIQTHLDVTENLSDEAWRRMIAVHLDGTFFCTREALRLMSRQNRGAIINLSSVAALDRHQPMKSPPFGDSHCPVKNEPSSDARNSAVAATSRGSPERPRGVRERAAARISGDIG